MAVVAAVRPAAVSRLVSAAPHAGGRSLGRVPSRVADVLVPRPALSPAFSRPLSLRRSVAAFVALRQTSATRGGPLVAPRRGQRDHSGRRAVVGGRDDGGEEEGRARLVLVPGAHMVPHPEKKHKGGEDAYFVSEDGQVLGVADGVGGWAQSGVDPGRYSKSLMAEAKEAAEAAAAKAEGPTLPADVLQKAYDRNEQERLVGSSTAVVVVADGRELKYANLGDSGFMVIRGDKLAFRTREQTHGFNTPYQIGTGGDRPADAEEGKVRLEEGDVIVMGTDGLFDNLFDREIVGLVQSGLRENRGPEELAKMIAHRAHQAAAKSTGEVPFGKNARASGYRFEGGKMDDITVVVAIASSSSSSPAPSAGVQHRAKY